MISPKDQNVLIVTDNSAQLFVTLTFLNFCSYRGHSQEYTILFPVLFSALDMFT